MDRIVLNMATMHRHGTAFYDFLRLRKSFFVDRLGWDIPHDGEVEMDQYDNPTAHYSLVLRDGRVVGGARTMPTTARWGAHSFMLRDAHLGLLPNIPAEIVVGESPDPAVWECTRVVVGDELTTQAERSECLHALVSGIVDVSTAHGARELTCLSPVTFVRALRRLGFDCALRGTPYREPTDGRMYAVMSMPARHSTLAPVEKPAVAVTARGLGSAAARPQLLHAPA